MSKVNAVVAGTLAALLALCPSGFAVHKVVGRVIARINSEIITNWQYERESEKLRAQLGQQYSGAELEAQMRAQSKNLLRDLIDQDLLVQKAKDLDINVETDVVKRLDEIRKRMNLETQADLQHEVEKQGIVWEDFEDNIRRNLLMQEVIGREVGSRIIISREDARKYYEAHKNDYRFPEGAHLAEILVSSSKHSDAEAQKRGQEALAKLKAGDRWATVCEKYSDDENTASEGGDLGFFKKGTLAPALEQAVDKLAVGDTTDLLKTQYGYMIIKVVQRRQEGIAPFEDVEQRVDETLYTDKLQPALRAYLATMRKQSYIALAPGYVDSGAERSSEESLPSERELAQADQ
jgi:peptidyl-prolyl cis-trans isomerase SurA